MPTLDSIEASQPVDSDLEANNVLNSLDAEPKTEPEEETGEDVGFVDDKLAGKFDSVEALEESYKNLEKLLGSKGNDEHDLKQKLADLEAKIGLLTEEEEEEDEEPWYGNFTPEQLNEAFVANPGEFLDEVTSSLVQREINRHLDARLGPLEQQYSATEENKVWADATVHAEQWCTQQGLTDDDVEKLQSVIKSNNEIDDTGSYARQFASTRQEVRENALRQAAIVAGVLAPTLGGQANDIKRVPRTVSGGKARRASADQKPKSIVDQIVASVNDLTSPSDKIFGSK